MNITVTRNLDWPARITLTIGAVQYTLTQAELLDVAEQITRLMASLTAETAQRKEQDR